MQFRCDFSCYLYFHGWVVGWSEDLGVMLKSTQDQIKLKLKFELSLAIFYNGMEVVTRKLACTRKNKIDLFHVIDFIFIVNFKHINVLGFSAWLSTN